MQMKKAQSFSIKVHQKHATGLCLDPLATLHAQDSLAGLTEEDSLDKTGMGEKRIKGDRIIGKISDF